MRATALLSLFALMFLSVAAHGADPAPPAAAANPAQSASEPQASIPFANRGGIYDWRVVDSRTVLIQGLDRQWYRASLMSSCFDLPFAQRIGFETNPDGSFDKFSSIKLRSQNCPLVSLVKSAPPAKQSKRHTSVDVTTAPSGSVPATSAPGTSAPQQH